MPSALAKYEDTILSFWFGESSGIIEPFKKFWFSSTPDFDARILSDFTEILNHVHTDKQTMAQMKSSAKGSLALIILFDQMPRNMFRGTQQMFAYDGISLPIALEIVRDSNHRQVYSSVERAFVYMCVEHSENIDNVKLAIHEFKQLLQEVTGKARGAYKMFLKSAKDHLAVLQTFGRYPHRNELLGRSSTQEELEYLSKTKSRFVHSVKATSSQSTRKLTGQIQPKLRILCLHNFRQNAHILRGSFHRILHGLSPYASLHFFDAPLPYFASGTDLQTLMATFTELPNTQHQRCWWYANIDNSVYQYLDTTLHYLNQIWLKQGPFDGVIGFSQGGALAGILAAMQPWSSIRFRFVVCISGFISRADEHKALLMPRSLNMPSLHIYGAADELVDNNRSLSLAECFKGSKVVSHPGGHFSPQRWPVNEIVDFVNNQWCLKVDIDEEVQKFWSKDSKLETKLEASIHKWRHFQNSDNVFWIPPVGLSEKPAEKLSNEKYSWMLQSSDLAKVGKALESEFADSNLCTFEDMMLLSWSLRPQTSFKHETDEVFYEFLLRVFQVNAEKFKADALKIIANYGSWKDINVLALANANSKICSEDLHLALIDAYVTQLKKDRMCIEMMINQGETRENWSQQWPSNCALCAPRMRGYVDKTTHLARDIAECMFPIRSPPENCADPKEYELYQKKKRSRMYAAMLVSLKKVLAHIDPETVILRHSNARRKDRVNLSSRSEEAMEKWLAEPLPYYVLRPEPMPVSPAPLAELDPLLDWMRMDLAVSKNADRESFLRGTVFLDGRLDLCKQVVGPDGIKPILSAMRLNSTIERFLLGNNIVGNLGAKQVAEYIKDPGSKIYLWYLAGNEFDAEGMAYICDALKDDDKVTALWLKRNPLSPEGGVHIANMLKQNKKLQVLDLLNCGILDSGAEKLINAMEMNSTLRYLYLDVNGLSIKTAKLLSDYLETGNSHLSALYISCNRFGDKGITELSRGLSKNRSIRRLALNSCGFGPSGMEALCNALIERNSELEALYLGYTRGTYILGGMANWIGDEGAQYIAKIILQGPKINLRYLDIVHNTISASGIRTIKEAFEQAGTDSTVVSLRFIQYGQAQNEVTKEWINNHLKQNSLRWAESVKSEYPQQNVEQIAARLVKRAEVPEETEQIFSVYRTKDQ